MHLCLGVWTPHIRSILIDGWVQKSSGFWMLLCHEGELRKRDDLIGPIRDIGDLPRNRIRDTYIFICYVFTY
jgi:hypothetical protein